jgi:hypothetical protein
VSKGVKEKEREINKKGTKMKKGCRKKRGEKKIRKTKERRILTLFAQEFVYCFYALILLSFVGVSATSRGSFLFHPGPDVFSLQERKKGGRRGENHRMNFIM